VRGQKNVSKRLSADAVYRYSRRFARERTGIARGGLPRSRQDTQSASAGAGN